jgi:uncharacterized protein (TIGR02285 family)
MTLRLRKLRDAFATVLFSIGLCQPVSASEPDSITWAVYDMAPSYFVPRTPDYKKLGDGIGDNLLKLLIGALPEYDHKFSLMTMPRVMIEMQANNPLCVLNVQLTPERAKVAYSTPLLITPGPELVLRRQLLRQHPQWKSGVSLSALSHDPTLNGQYQAGRSFGAKLDEIVRSATNLNLKLNGSASAINALRMIDLGRSDYTIEYPELVKLGIQNKDISDNVTTVPILEANPFVDSYVLCTRSDWGLTTMRRIDAALHRLASKPEYRRSLEKWLQKDELQVHKNEYERFYRTRAKNLFCDPTCP